MNNIQIFSNPQFGNIRTTGTPDEPWFCAADVCKALGYNNGRDAVAKHVDTPDVAKRDIGVRTGTRADGTPAYQTVSTTFVNESGLYALIFGSKLPTAKAFKKWVTSEVLPSIRKTGQYGSYEVPKTFAEALLLAAKNQQKIEEQQRMIAEKQMQIEKDAPKVLFTDAVIGSKSSVLIGELAKMLSVNGYTIGQNRLFALLREQGYLGKSGEYYNIPNQAYIEQGLFELKKTTHSENGTMKTSTTTKVTGKGQVYFINKFLKRSNQLNFKA